MEPKPVKKAKPPRYPTRLEVLADPELLARHLPPAWRVSSELAGAVTLFLAANGAVNAADDAPPPVEAALVAPIFEHGAGRGATGCVVVAPPVFLSEEEALQIITEELAEYGLEFGKDALELDGVLVSQQVSVGGEWVDDHWEPELEQVPDTERTLELDRVDAERRVAVEFVSRADYFDMGGPEDSSSVQMYDFPDVIEKVAEDVREADPEVRVAFFYDPMVRGPSRDKWLDRSARQEADDEDESPGIHETPKARSRRFLRLQVKDFVDWLKAQGAI